MECVDSDSDFAKEKVTLNDSYHGVENEYDQLSLTESSTLRSVTIEEKPPRKLKKEYSLKRIIILVSVIFFASACLALLLIFVLKAVLSTASKSDVIHFRNACSSPPYVPESTRLYTSTAVGTIAYYRCRDGFKLIGDPHIFCHNNGSWSDVLFSCTKDCGSPPHVTKSTRIYTKTTAGAIANYRCRDNYELVGDPRIFCQENGSWSDVLFFCEKDCGSPPYVTESSMIYTRTIVGAIVNYRCLDGFTLVGDPHIFCHDNGVWSNIMFSCEKDIFVCVVNFRLRLTTICERKYSIANYRCQGDYGLVGDPRIFCQDNGSWSDVLFSCEKDCGSPPNITESTRIYTRTTVGAIVNYRCQDGFILAGDPHLFCHNNGSWSNIMFSCEKDCGPPPYVTDSTRIYTKITVGAIANYRCLDDFELVGDSHISCQDNGSWSDVLFSCEKDCVSPPYVSESTRVYTRTTVGAIANYRCRDNFELVGDPHIFCQDNGSWSDVLFSCKKVAASHKRPKEKMSGTDVNGSTDLRESTSVACGLITAFVTMYLLTGG